MISCPESTRLLSRRMDERLSLLARLSLRAHLRRCPACTRCAAQFRYLRVIMRGAGRPGRNGAATALTDDEVADLHDPGSRGKCVFP